MSATTTQVVELAKRGFAPQQIAEALNFTVDQVNLLLQRDGDALKELAKADSSQLDAKFQSLEDIAFQGLEHLAKYAESEETRRKAYEFILKQRMGLMKPRERITAQNNITFLIQRVEKARQIRDASVQGIDGQVRQVASRTQEVEKPVIDVEIQPAAF